jgi:hypothetical protein
MATIHQDDIREPLEAIVPYFSIAFKRQRRKLLIIF